MARTILYCDVIIIKWRIIPFNIHCSKDPFLPHPIEPTHACMIVDWVRLLYVTREHACKFNSIASHGIIWTTILYCGTIMYNCISYIYAYKSIGNILFVLPLHLTLLYIIHCLFINDINYKWILIHPPQIPDLHCTEYATWDWAAEWLLQRLRTDWSRLRNDFVMIFYLFFTLWHRKGQFLR